MGFKGRLKWWKLRLLVILFLDSLWGLLLWLWFLVNRTAIRARVMKVLMGRSRIWTIFVFGFIGAFILAGCRSMSERYSFFSAERHAVEKPIVTVKEALDPGTSTFWKPLELINETFLDNPSDPDVVILRDLDEIFAP